MEIVGWRSMGEVLEYRKAFLSYHMDCGIHCSLLLLYIGLLIPDPCHILNIFSILR